MESKWILRRLVGWGGLEWIHPAQDRDHWRALVSVVMSLWVLAAWNQLVTVVTAMATSGSIIRKNNYSFCFYSGHI
jgi:hypothetical protein